MAKSISQLTTQATANDGDLFEVAIVDANSASGYASKKESAAVIAEGIVNQYTYPLGMPNMQAKTILGAINQLLANVAAVYDDTATYSEGDFRTYNGQLYKCNTDIGTAETFDPTKWDAVNLADNLGSGGGGINYSATEQVVGKWYDGTDLYECTFSSGWAVAAQTSSAQTRSLTLNPSGIKDLIWYELIPVTLNSLNSAVQGNARRADVFSLIVNGDITVSSGTVGFLNVTAGANLTWIGFSDVIVKLRYTKIP